MLGQLDPFLRNINPFFSFLGQYKREIAAMLANDTAATQATDQIGQDRVHYLRLTEPGEPRGARDLPGSRRAGGAAIPYYKPGTYDQLRSGLPVFNGDHCGANRRSPRIPPSPYLAEEFRNRIIQYVLNGGNTLRRRAASRRRSRRAGGRPPYPHVRPDPRPSP